ncbi:MAG: c-type cytochrome [Sphingomonas sp.]
MGPVIASLSNVPDTDILAISTYIASQMAGSAGAVSAIAPIDQPGPAQVAFPQGATLFAGACAGCHGPGAPMIGQGRPPLAFSSDLRDDDPSSAIQAVLLGIEPPLAGRGPKMPGFADRLHGPAG